MRIRALAAAVLLAVVIHPHAVNAQESGTWSQLPPLPGDFPPESCEPDAESETALPCLPAPPGFGPGWLAPAGAQTPLLLMDGSVFVHQNRSLNWWRLVPNASGDYANGTWIQAASMIATPTYDYNPLYYCSALLPDGRVVVMGGEYNWEINATTGVGSYVVRELNRGEIYNPYANVWTALPGPSGWSQIGDMMCTVMPATGRLMLARQSSTQLATLNPTTLTWTVFTPTGKTSGDSNGEEGWTLLQDGTVMVVNANTGMSSQRFIPNGTGAGTWVNAGAIPVPMRDSSSHETGAQVLMYNGKVFAAGADRNTGSNAVFTPPPTTTPPSTALGSWATAPAFPRKPYAATLPSTNCTGTAPNLMCQLDQADGPGVLMPNGRVLVNAGPGVFNKDTYWFEYDPTTNALNEVGRPPNSETKVQYQYHMLLLPSGQVFAPDGTATVPIYTGSGSPNPSWAPAITSVPASLKPGSTYSLSGKQLNGLSEAVSYGDDYAAATNYPIIKITNHATGHVFWARTHDRDNLNVATGNTIITTQFDVPANLELGTSDIVVIANGIPSAPVEVNHPPVTTAALAGTAGHNSWFVSDVQVTLTATDPDGASDIVVTHYSVDLGPVQDYSGPFTVSGDAKHHISFWSEDQAGDQDTPAKAESIWIDTTPPTLTFGAQSPAANGNGWNNSAVDITYTTADNLSGVASSTPASALHFGAEGAAQTQTVVVTDDAGNSATFTSAAVNIDTTAPTLTFGAQSPAANGNGWNNSAVDIGYTTSDNLSGVASSTPASALHFGADGAAQTQTVTVTDQAGNTATFTTAAVNIDQTAPTLTAAAGTMLWPPNNKMVPDMISGVLGDALSGIDFGSAVFRVVDEYGTVQPSGAVTVAANGHYSFTVLLEASRLGQDLDGRHYQVIVTASDRSGNPVTASAVVTVAHDQGQ